MPSSMIHLLTGVAFTTTSNLVKNKSQFFLGCIAPDAVNVYTFAPKIIRTKAHLRSPDIEQWAQNAIDFYTDNKSKIDNDLLMGYVLHTFCDLAWDKKYEADFSSALKTLNLSESRWDEFYAFDKAQFSSEWWLNEVRPSLEKSIPCDINGIDKKQIADFKEYVLFQYEQSIKADGHNIITPELVSSFIYYAVAMFKNEL